MNIRKITILTAIVASVLTPSVYADQTPTALPGGGARGGVGGILQGTNTWQLSPTNDIKNGSGLPVDLADQKALNIQAPQAPTDAANKGYLDATLNQLKVRIGALESGLVAPTITNIAPLAVLRGATITITGVHFTGADVVTFTGGATAVPTVTNDTTITVVVPNGAQNGTVQVHTSGGTATSSQSLSVYDPITVTGVSPSSAGPGSTITITGTGFLGAQSVTFPGGVSASSFTIVNNTTITVTIPASAPQMSGFITVSRTNPNTAGTIAFTVGPDIGNISDFGTGVTIAAGTPSDNVPVIAWVGTGGAVYISKCSDANCSSSTVKQTLGGYSSDLTMRIDRTGKPVVGWRTGTGSASVFRCADVSCTSLTTTTAYAPFDILADNSIVYATPGTSSNNTKICNTTSGCIDLPGSTTGTGTSIFGVFDVKVANDGNPVISFIRYPSNLVLYKCYISTCSTGGAQITIPYGKTFDKIFPVGPSGYGYTVSGSGSPSIRICAAGNCGGSVAMTTVNLGNQYSDSMLEQGIANGLSSTGNWALAYGTTGAITTSVCNDTSCSGVTSTNLSGLLSTIAYIPDDYTVGSDQKPLIVGRYQVGSSGWRLFTKKCANSQCSN